MFKKIDKLLASMGNIGAMERLHVDTHTEEKMESVDGDLLAESEAGKIYFGMQELNGYLFMETIFISKTNIKTLKGSMLYFKSDNGDFELSSDTQEIESEFSNVSNRFICQISFDITTEDINRIQDQDYTAVEFSFKKKKLAFEKS